MTTAINPVLVLDVQMRPLRVEHWTKVIGDLFLGKVEVVEYSRDRMIQGIGREYQLPAVVRVARAFKRDKVQVRFSRLNIYARDGFTCQYCGERCDSEDLNFDHVVPRSQGGRTTWENIVTCCLPCNGAKANRTPAQAGMALRRAPKKPHTLPAITVKFNGSRVPEEWKPYWSTELER